MWIINLLSAALTVTVGTILLFRLRFFFILHPIKCVRRIFHIVRDRDRRRSLLLALAGTLGVGNIYGVALGIILAGPGCVFWLFISSFFAMVVKYSESLVATGFSSRGRGMMVPIEKSFGRAGKPIASLYCGAMLILSLFMGGFIQADSVISSAVYLFSVKKVIIALLFLVPVILVISGGGNGIKNATEALIPVATVFYVVLSVIVLSKDISRLGQVIPEIIRSAFSPVPAFFGILPTVSYSALSQGFARGLLSNEAGAGSSAMAHSESGCDPTDAGLLGILEILFDTNLLCILTALVILCEVEDPSVASSSMSLVFSAFASGAGRWSILPLFACIVLFAYSTVICWYYYGIRCLSYLSLNKSSFVYSFAFCIFLFSPTTFVGIGAVYVSDVLLLLMSLPTLFCLLRNAKSIETMTLSSAFLEGKRYKRTLHFDNLQTK